MKILYSLLLIICTCSTTLAQRIDLPTDYLRNKMFGLNDLPNDVTGSPYLDENFHRGEVTIEGKSFEADIRYDALNDAFEIKSGDGQITSLVRRPDIKVSFNNNDYEIFSFKDVNDLEKQRYFKVLANGKTKFLKSDAVELKDAVPSPNGYGKGRPAALVSSEKYYLKKGDVSATEIRLRKRPVLKEFDDSRVDAYVKEHRLKLKDENEMVQLINYYNTL